MNRFTMICFSMVCCFIKLCNIFMHNGGGQYWLACLAVIRVLKHSIDGACTTAVVPLTNHSGPRMRSLFGQMERPGIIWNVILDASSYHTVRECFCPQGDQVCVPLETPKVIWPVPITQCGRNIPLVITLRNLMISLRKWLPLKINLKRIRHS